MIKKASIFSLLFLSLFACEHEIPAAEEKVSSFSYSSNQLELVKGDSIFSETPIFHSSSDVNFNLKTTPSTSAISIDEKGIIKVNSSCAVGVYSISVNVNNAGGESLFSNVLQVRVQSKIISFASDVLPIINQSCSPCHTEKNQSTLYTDYDNASALYELIIDRVKSPKSSGLTMPPSPSEPLSKADIDLIAKWNTDGLNQ